jgi:hypothetical protein
MIGEVLKTYTTLRKALSTDLPRPNEPREYDVDYLYLHTFDAGQRPLLAALLTIAVCIRETKT